MQFRIVLTALVIAGITSAGARSATPKTEETQEVVPPSLSVDEIIAAGASFMDLKHYEEAIQAFSLALQIEPNNGRAYANRALAYAWTNRLDQASSDLRAAEALIPDQAVLNRARALIALRRSDEDTALTELSKALEKEPGNAFALNYRAWIFHKRGKEAEALADADAYIQARPDDPDTYVLKADLLRAQSKPLLAAAEAERITKLFPGDAYGISAAARIYDALGERERAMEAIDTAITIDPDFFHYYKLRAAIRRKSDLDGRRLDLEAALERQSDDLGVITELGLLDFQQRKWADAILKFSVILNTEWRDFGVLAYRAMARLQAGQKDLAAKDYGAAIAAASGASDFSLICHSFAKENIALDWALESCNRAIALDASTSSYRANRGLVHLRLGQLKEALSDYNQAIAADSRQARSFFGRALVRLRMGDVAGAQADRATAVKLDPTITETFRDYRFTEL